MVPYIEHAIPIDGLLALAIDRDEIAPIIRILRKGVGPGVTEHV